MTSRVADRVGAVWPAIVVAVVTVLVGCSGGTGATDGRGYLSVESPRLGLPGTVRLSDLAGRPVVVNFFASWCAPCVREMPEIERVKQQAGDAVAFVGVNVQEPEADGLALVERSGVTWEIVHDPRGVLVQAMGVQGMPTTVLLDAQGRIVDTHTGALDADRLTAMLRDRLGVEIAA